MADVFISYSKAEHALVAALAADLEQCGCSVWWDVSLLSGDNYRSVILKELDRAKAVIVVWTPTSIASDWVISEADRAAHGHKLIPVRTARVDPISIPPPYGTRHTELVDNREAIVAALRRVGVAVAPNASTAQPVSPGPARPPTETKTADGGEKLWHIGLAMIIGLLLMVGGAFMASKPQQKVRGPSQHKVFEPGKGPLSPQPDTRAN
jgi:hypothetical protein